MRFDKLYPTINLIGKSKPLLRAFIRDRGAADWIKSYSVREKNGWIINNARDISYITNPIYFSLLLDSNKTYDLMDKLKPQSGVLLIPSVTKQQLQILYKENIAEYDRDDLDDLEVSYDDPFTMKGPVTIFFNLESNGDLFWVAFTKDSEIHTYFLPEGTYCRFNVNQDAKVDPFIASDYKEILTILVFLQFAEIRTKVCTPRKKIPDFNCVYSNYSNQDIKIIDNTYFTNLYVKGEFNVRGHWRNQPHGHRLKKNKLIWINGYTKHGYTRKAKILQ